MSTHTPNHSTPEEHLLKLIIIGDCGVGKTNILVRFCSNQFKQNYVATIGVDFKIKTITVKDHRLKLQIWDTAGQQRFKNIAYTYYKGASGIILAYAINDAKSFENIEEKWMIQVNQHAPNEVMKMLIANKSDMEEQRVVTFKEGQVLAKKYNMKFMEVSAKTGQNVKQAFNVMGQTLVSDYLPSFKQKKMSTRLSGYSVKKDQEKKKKKCC